MPLENLDLYSVSVIQFSSKCWEQLTILNAGGQHAWEIICCSSETSILSISLLSFPVNTYTHMCMSHTCTCAHTCAYTPTCFAHLHTTRGARPLYSACLLMISWFPQNEGLWLTPTWESSRKRRVNDGRESNVLSELKLFFDPWCGLQGNTNVMCFVCLSPFGLPPQNTTN